MSGSFFFSIQAADLGLLFVGGFYDGFVSLDPQIP